MTKIKICGITNPEDALLSVKFGVDALGFNFYPESPRFITPECARKIIDRLPARVLKVGVFVNEKLGKIIDISKIAGLNAVQLHGEESPDFVSSLKAQTGMTIIKAFRVSTDFEPEDVLPYEIDAILLDADSQKGRGGTGETFDWEIANEVKSLFPRMYLAGGLSPENVADAICLVRPFAVDTCSRLESEPGKKDTEKLRRFIAAVNETK